MLNRLIIFINNLWRQLRKKKAEPGQVLLLLPYCIQNKSCGYDLTLGIRECRRCGKCAMKELSILAEQYQVKAKIVGGGQQAIQATKDKNVHIVVAVACEKELAAGILATFGKPILTVKNKNTSGPCVNTDVDSDLVRAALERAIKV